MWQEETGTLTSHNTMYQVWIHQQGERRMSNMKTLLKKIQALPNHPNKQLKDVICEIYEALEWITNVLDEEREQ